MLAHTCLKRGVGLPLVFLHGFLGTSLDWEPVCSFLPPSSCFGVDLPGHGASPFTENFCDEMPLFETKIHLIGYSMGGRLALQYAARFPEKIASLSIASAHLGLRKDEQAKKYREDCKWAHRLLTSEIDEFLKSWYDQTIFGGFCPDLTMRQKQNPLLLAQCLTHYSLGKQPLFSPKNLSVLVGEKDEKYRLLFPHATVVPGSAHMVHLENPQAFARIIEKRLFS